MPGPCPPQRIAAAAPPTFPSLNRAAIALPRLTWPSPGYFLWLLQTHRQDPAERQALADAAFTVSNPQDACRGLPDSGMLAQSGFGLATKNKMVLVKTAFPGACSVGKKGRRRVSNWRDGLIQTQPWRHRLGSRNSCQWMRVTVLECTASISIHSGVSAGGSAWMTLETKKCLLQATGCTAVHLVSSSFLGCRAFMPMSV